VGFPQYGWKQAIPREPSARFPRRLYSALAAHSVAGLSYPVLWSSGLPTGPWLSPVYHTRASKRYYGLMRQSDGLRPVWLPSLLWPVFALAGGPPHLPFFALSHFARMPRPLPRWRLDFRCWFIHRAWEPSPELTRFGCSRMSPHRILRRIVSRGGSLLVMLRPARMLGLLSGPRRFPTGQPVYSRACSSEGLPPSESAMTSRLNQQLPRQDLHLLAFQRTKAALSPNY